MQMTSPDGAGPVPNVSAGDAAGAATQLAHRGQNQGEMIIFSLGAAIVVFEVNRQAMNKELKELDERSHWVAILVGLEELQREVALQQQDIERLHAALREFAPASPARPSPQSPAPPRSLAPTPSPASTPPAAVSPAPDNLSEPATDSQPKVSDSIPPQTDVPASRVPLKKGRPPHC